MKNKAVSFDINLLPKDPFLNTPAGKVLKWALSVGRYIVVFTELIVILSFVTRFTLDRQVTDLNETISQKKNVIDSYGDLEEEVRRMQLILNEYSTTRQQVNMVEIFPELTRVIPRDTTLDELVIRTNQVSLTGKTLRQDSFSTIVNNLQLSDKFTNINIEKVESTSDKDGSGFEFMIRANTKPAEVKETSTRSVEKVNVLDRTQGIDNL